MILTREARKSIIADVGNGIIEAIKIPGEAQWQTTVLQNEGRHIKIEYKITMTKRIVGFLNND